MSDRVSTAQLWDQLEREFRWSRGFFVIHVFAATPGQAKALGARMREYADPATLAMHTAVSGADLHQLATGLQSMLEEFSRPTDYFHRPILWIDGSREFEREEGAPWRSGWFNLVARLNERREPMQKCMRALILLAPPQAKPVLRSIGPDLWSIRSQTLDFPRPQLSVPSAASPRHPTLDAQAAERARTAMSRAQPREASGVDITMHRIGLLRSAARLARAEVSIDALVDSSPIRDALIEALDGLDAHAPAAAQIRDQGLDAWIEQAEAATDLGDVALASDLLDRLTEILQRSDPVANSRDAMLATRAKVIAGELALQAGPPAQARRELCAAEERLHAESGGQPSPLTPRIELGLARAAEQLGEQAQAIHRYERLFALERSTLPLRALARLAMEEQAFEQAIQLLRDAVPLAAPSELHEQVGIRRELAAALMGASHWPAARVTLDAALELAGSGSTLEADVLVDLAQWHLAEGDEPHARSSLSRAVAIRRVLLGEEHELTRAARTALEKIMKSSLVMLHVSDLHFGPHGRFGDQKPDAVGKRLVAAIEALRSERGIDEVDLVVASGDLTAMAKPAEFEQAREFFEALVGEFGIGRDRFAFVPGNHDFSWAKIRIARAQQADEEFDEDELERRIHGSKFVYYRAFIDRFYGEFAATLPRVSLTPAGWVQDLPDLRISLGLLNSSERETDQQRGGAVSERQAQALLSHWVGERHDPSVRIVVVHHNPKSNTPENVEYIRDELSKRAGAGRLDDAALHHFMSDVYGFSGKREFAALVEQGKVSLVLHGHIHAPVVDSIVWQHGGDTKVLGAGSMGAEPGHLPADQPHTVQLIALHLNRRTADVHRLVYHPHAKVEGSVVRGNFVPEVVQTGGQSSFALTLPAGFVGSATEAELATACPASTDRTFLTEYRTKLAHQHEVWEFGAMQRGVREASVVTLDDMYVPLRFRQKGAKQADVIEPEQLLARCKHLVVRGGPGSGKTTWLRWTFRRLLERDDVLPIFLELRALAKDWSQREATLEEQLTAWVDRRVGSGWREAFAAALGQARPRPILLIDGWDELGGLGLEFGEWLAGFAGAHPEVRIVATSRPYGEGVPNSHGDFEHVNVEPMADGEVASFVRNFFERVHRSEAHRVADDVDRFLATLVSNPNARELGRTPLLLVMLLLVGRDQPLPDQRHDLYRVCIENLLDFRPKKRQREGVVQGTYEWAPERYAERLRASAMVAFAMQSKHLGRKEMVRRSQVANAGRGTVAGRTELVKALPKDWDPHQREGFLNWLASGAGLLVERDDGSFQFAHLGFQEYLTARHLDALHDGKDDRLAIYRSHAEYLDWWETLRLWASVLDSRSPDHIGSVIEELVNVEDSAQYWLAGALLADGVGARAFDVWVDALPRRFDRLEYPFSQWCAAAWKPCQQHERRSRIAVLLGAAIHSWSWVSWWRADSWWKAAGLTGELRKPEASGAAWVVGTFDTGPSSSERAMAWGRVWMSTSPFWGLPDPLLLTLRLWPNRRQWLGWLAQSALSFGAPDRDLVDVMMWGFRQTQHRHPGMDPTIKGVFRRHYVVRRRHVEGDLWGKAIGAALASDLSYCLKWLAGVEGHHSEPIVNNMALSSISRIVSKVVHYNLHSVHPDSAVQLAANMARVVAHECLVSDWDFSRLSTVLRTSLSTFPDQLWLEDLSRWLLHSEGFAGVRTLLAFQANPHWNIVDTIPLAARCSLDPSLDPTPLTLPHEGHELWHALARHIARISTPQDRALLEDYARHPEKADTDPMRWGLQYWVRGDIMLEDGTTMTLDELWIELRKRFPEEDIPDLPMLEDMPPEPEFDWVGLEPEPEQ